MLKRGPGETDWKIKEHRQLACLTECHSYGGKFSSKLT